MRVIASTRHDGAGFPFGFPAQTVLQQVYFNAQRISIKLSRDLIPSVVGVVEVPKVPDPGDNGVCVVYCLITHCDDLYSRAYAFANLPASIPYEELRLCTYVPRPCMYA